MDQGEFDNANLLEVAKFSPTGQGQGGFQAVNLASPGSTGEQRMDSASPGVEVAQADKQVPAQQPQPAYDSSQPKRDYMVPQPDGSLQIKGPVYMRWKKPHELANSFLGSVIAGGAMSGFWGPAAVGTLLGPALDYIDFRYPSLTYEPEQVQEPQKPEAQTPPGSEQPAPIEDQPAPFDADPNEGLA